MEEIVKIYTLGRFEVSKGERVLTEKVTRVSKLWKLFQYLFTYRKRDVPIEELIDVLDLEGNSYPAGSLTALVYRLRKLLAQGENEEKKELILTRGSSYSFNRDADYWLDAEKFTDLCYQTQSEVKNKSKESYFTYLQALDLYKGDYLDDLKSEEWIWSARNRYRDLLVSTLDKLDNYLTAQGMYEELWQIYERAQELIQFDEDLIRGSIEALLASGNKGLARIKYEEAVALYQENNLILPPEIRNLKTRMENHQVKNDPDTYLRSMLNSSTANEAYVCDSETFTMLYDLEKRRSQRQDNPRYLVHLILDCRDSKQIQMDEEINEIEEIEEIEEKGETREKNKTNKDSSSAEIKGKDCLPECSNSLLEILQKQLRRGDVISRWSTQHFIIMLINLGSDDVKRVLERIENAFKDMAGFDGDIELKSRFYQI